MNSHSELLRTTLQDFSKKELMHTPRLCEVSFYKILEKAFEIGLFQPGFSIKDTCLILEQLSQSNSSLAVLVFSHLASLEILSFSDLCEASPTPVAFSPFFNFFESTPLAKATLKEGSYSLTGRSESLLLTDHSQHALIPAEIGRSGLTYFLIPLTAQGIKTSSPIRTLGLQYCRLIDLELDNVLGLPVGTSGEGPLYFEQMLNRMSLAGAAVSLGLARGSLSDAIQYAQTRQQGGREIIQWSEIKMMLSNMTIRIKNAELALSQACEAFERKDLHWEENVSAVSLSIQELAPLLTSDGIQILGGAGYTHEFKQEARFRDAYQVQNLLGSLAFRKLRHAQFMNIRE